MPNSTKAGDTWWWINLCGNRSDDDAFWSDNVTARMTRPDLTLCFQNSVLVYIPCIYLWACSLVWVPYLASLRVVNKWPHVSRLNRVKLVIGGLLAAIFAADLLYALRDFLLSSDLPIIHVVKYSVLFSTMLTIIQLQMACILRLEIAVMLASAFHIHDLLLSIFLTYYEFHKGRISDGVLFFYWLLLLLLNIVQFRSYILHISYSPQGALIITDLFYFFTFYTSYAFILTQFFLSLFADVKANRSRPIGLRTISDSVEKRPNGVASKGIKIGGDSFGGEDITPLTNGCAIESPDVVAREIELKRECPEMTASFLSRLTFFWISGMIVRGYRRMLTAADLWQLRPVDASHHILPRFERQWKKELFKLNHERTAAVLVGSAGLGLGLAVGRGPEETRKFVAGAKTQKSSSHRQPSAWKAIVRTFGFHYAIGGLYKLIYDLISFVSPLILSELIQFVATNDPFVWRGYLLVSSLFIVSIIRTVVMHQYYHNSYVTGQRLRTAVVGLVYRKSLRLNNESRRSTTQGEIVNLMSVDAQKLQDAPAYMHMVWSTPLTITLAIYLLWFYTGMGASVFAGLGAMLLLVPINGYVAKKTKTLQQIQMKHKDLRIKLMNEILNGIKVLKLYAWEDLFRSNVRDAREKELAVLKTSQYLGAATSVSWFMAPYLVNIHLNQIYRDHLQRKVALVTFAVYVLSSDDHVLDANKAFVSLSLFNILNYPLSILPMVISYGIQAAVSIRRIGNFLLCEEVDERNVDRDNPDIEAVIEVRDGSFAWAKNETATIRNLNLRVPDGGLVAVVGHVGSGKSSVIAALCGEMEVLQGKVSVRGSIAYVPQQAWIQNASLKDNILFSKEYKDAKYQNVIEACALCPDIRILPAGDKTEVGEKGINLSGGQKQRISLARAVYENADVYLLDDPLSAVDSHVGKHIFEEVIGPMGLLKNKTRVLVTNSVTYLSRMDLIVVLRHGQISEMGTYQDLLSHKGAFAEYILTYLQSDSSSDDDVAELRQLARQISRISIVSDEAEKDMEKIGGGRGVGGGGGGEKSDCDSLSSVDINAAQLLHRKSRVSSGKSDLPAAVREDIKLSKKQRQDQRLTEDESAMTGNVKLSVYGAYLMACRLVPVCMTIAWYIAYLAAQIATNIWLSRWSTDANLSNGTYVIDTALRDQRLGVYGGLGIAQAIGVFGMSFSIAISCISSSRLLHSDLLRNLLRAPMSFFDTTPLGRIVNRFSRDIDTVDISIPLTIRIWLGTFSGVVTTLVVITISTPMFAVVILPLVIIYYFVQRFYISTSRQLRRIDSVLRSPIYVHFSETVAGVSSIRAYSQQQRFIEKSDRLTDSSQMANYPILISNRWLGVWLELIGSFIVLFSGLFAVIQRDTIDAGGVGLSVSYALQVTGALNIFVRMTSDLETYIVSIERINEYVDCPKEPIGIIPDKRPPRGWPSEGRIEFNNYSLRYRPNLDLVLCDVTCVIEGGEKVGIVGRTGAGKSSLTLGLFRIIEAASGSVLIDGINIADMGLSDLRSKLTIIPQDPVLFSGTLRMNLDPFESRTDAEVWRAVKQSHLESFVSSQPAQLLFECTEGGENLSVGQRQLVCLARALLRKTKVLILDEATAAVDLETDDLIQKTIRTEFKDCTVLTIAHRLNTIIDYSRVLVLDKSRVAEFDSPSVLLQDKEGIFYSMAKDAGIISDFRPL